MQSGAYDDSARRRCYAATVGLALALFVARVFADHHDYAMTANHFALIADRLNARLDLHRIPFDCNLITGEIRGSYWATRRTIYPYEHDLNAAEATFNDRVLLITVDDTTTGQVVGAQFHYHAILRQDSNVVLTHLTRDVRENLVTIV